MHKSRSKQKVHTNQNACNLRHAACLPVHRSAIKQKVPGHEITAEASLHARYNDWNAQAIEAPRLLSLEISSDVATRSGGLRYQGGLYEVTSEGSGSGSGGNAGPRHVSRYIQCAAAFERQRQGSAAMG